jgi:hypothetical protein
VFNHNVMKIYGRVKVNLHAFLGPLTSLWGICTRSFVFITERRSEQAGVVVTFQTYILEELGSNTCITNWGSGL